MFSIEGACEKLTQGEEDFSAACLGSVLQIVYDDGRVGLYAFADGPIFAFSGADDEMVSGELWQALDKVLYGVSEAEIQEFAVDGTCIYENPFAGVARFECDAMAENGTTFSLVFITDGSEPVDQLAN
jgi:hypothetical protein